MSLKLWLIHQSVNDGYDTYDSAVVAAETEDEARRTDPGYGRVWSDERNCWLFSYADGRLEPDKNDAWVDDLDVIKVELIGEAAPGVQPGVIVASFNAG